MSGDTFHFGDSVTMNGGVGNTGIVKHQAAPAATGADSALQEALRDLAPLLRDLRERVSPMSAEMIDDSLDDLDAEGESTPRGRHRALMAVSGIAQSVGAVGAPALEAVNRVLAMLSPG
ncbi:hypothetical protein [Streptomyces sp. BBFR102]|uniref:hypothetical protein n=1 Tax=Streptomyces sp. BBFR102 TaxID=3448171 RepID=UPI003F53B5A0